MLFAMLCNTLPHGDNKGYESTLKVHNKNAAFPIS